MRQNLYSYQIDSQSSVVHHLLAIRGKAFTTSTARGARVTCPPRGRFVIDRALVWLSAHCPNPRYSAIIQLAVWAPSVCTTVWLVAMGGFLVRDIYILSCCPSRVVSAGIGHIVGVTNTCARERLLEAGAHVVFDTTSEARPEQCSRLDLTIGP